MVPPFHHVAISRRHSHGLSVYASPIGIKIHITICRDIWLRNHMRILYRCFVFTTVVLEESTSISLLFQLRNVQVLHKPNCGGQPARNFRRYVLHEKSTCVLLIRQHKRPTNLHFYAPNFEEVEGAYWFGSVRAVSQSVSLSVSQSVMHK